MKNYKLLTFFVGLLLVGSLSAQDDLYYNPAKDKVVFDEQTQTILTTRAKTITMTRRNTPMKRTTIITIVLAFVAFSALTMDLTFMIRCM